MPSVGNWSRAKYGPLHDQWFDYNTDAAGSDLPALVYFAGGGWSRTHPKAFHEVSVGEEVWIDGSDGIHTNIGAYPVSCFSVNYGLHRTDYAAGGDNDPHDRVLDQESVTPRYGSNAVRDAQRFISFLKENASLYSIDARKIITMGHSAGGPLAASVAYGPPRPFLSNPDTGGGAPGLLHRHSRVAGVHLKRSPVDWRDYLEGGIAGHGLKLVGLADSTVDWVAVEEVRRGSYSPLQLGEVYGFAPTWLWYPDDDPIEPAQTPPYFHPALDWVTSTAYVVGDRRRDLTSIGHYYCHTGHTSGASTQPGVGGSWETVWDIAFANPYHAAICGRTCFTALQAAGVQVIFGHANTGHDYPVDTIDWMKTIWDRI